MQAENAVPQKHESAAIFRKNFSAYCKRVTATTNAFVSFTGGLLNTHEKFLLLRYFVDSFWGFFFFYLTQSVSQSRFIPIFGFRTF